MATETFKWNTDDSDHIRALQRAQADVVKLTAKYNTLAQQMKSGHGQFKRAQSEQQTTLSAGISSLGRFAAGFLSVGAAVGVVRQAYSEWSADIQRLGQEHTKLISEVARGLTETGDLAQAGRLGDAFRSVPGATRAQAFAAFRAAREALPGPEGLLRSEQIARAAAPLSPITDEAALARLAAQLGKVAPGRSGEQLTALALAATQASGGRAQELGDPATQRAVALLTRRGQSVEEGLALAIGGLNKNVQPRALEALAAGGKLSRAQGAKLGLIDQGQVAEIAGRLTAAGRPGFIGGELQRAAQAPDVAEALATARGEASAEKAAFGDALLGARRQRAEKFLDRELDREGANFLREFVAGVLFRTHLAGSNLLGNDDPANSAGAALGASRRLLNSRLPFSGLAVQALEGSLETANEPAVRALKVQEQQLEELRAIRRGQGRGDLERHRD